LGITRREALRRCGMGFGALALGSFLGPEVAPAGAINPLAAKAPHFPAKAKRVIHLFMNGGPSHIDTFDNKPLLHKMAGQAIPTGNLRTERPTGAVMPSPFKFSHYGQSGIEVSELFRHTAQSIDD